MAYNAARESHISYESVYTTDATVTTIKTIPIKSPSVVRIVAKVTGQRTGGVSGTAGDAAGYFITACVKNVSGTAAIIGSVTTIAASEDQGAWDCTISVTGGTALVTVAGAAGNNVSWYGAIETVENL